ncbi:MAG: (2Fe-2S)-binding protein [Desulfobacterales bacterium]|nr:(2Fe-2S)-binding protein [Desulfobacterales bacterium]
MKTYPVKIKVNGKWKEAAVTARDTLLDVLRKKWLAYEVKNGCSEGDCGACTVNLNGKTVNACLVLALQANGKEVTTLKGIGTEQNPHPIQKAFVEKGGIQCGFCSPGMIMSSKALLDKNPVASRSEIREGLSGNLCRCTGYHKIVDAVEHVAKNNQS